MRYRLQTLPVGDIGDLAGNAASAPSIRHQDGIATGKRQIGGECSALIAALFLDNLHQQNLATLDHFLDFILATNLPWTIRHIIEGVAAAELLNRVFFVCPAILRIAGIIVSVVISILRSAVIRLWIGS